MFIYSLAFLLKAWILNNGQHRLRGATKERLRSGSLASYPKASTFRRRRKILTEHRATPVSAIAAGRGCSGWADTFKVTPRGGKLDPP